ncbi:phage tail protein [Pseudoduganella flava]|nr:tail fiber protein [Pseudoduganella flava]
MIIPWPMNWAPADWAMCNGQLLPMQQYMALYSLIGTVYGGDGKTTFGLPNLCGKFPMGAPNPGQIGQTGGAASATATVTSTGSVTIGLTNLPAHSHGATFTGGTSGSVSIAIPVDSDSNATDSVPTTTMVLGKPVSGTVAVKAYSTGAQTDTLKPFDVTLPAASGSVATTNTGDGTALPLTLTGSANMATLPPFVTMNFIICVNGLYPSRP